MIKPRVDLDDEQTRLLTYDQAHAASVEHLGLVAAVSADVCGTVLEPDASGEVRAAAPDPFADEMADVTDELAYRAALAALSGVVQRSLRDFLS